MKRPAEEDYNSNVHAKRAKDEEDGGSEQTTLRFLLESKVRTVDSDMDVVLLPTCNGVSPVMFYDCTVYLTRPSQVDHMLSVHVI